MYGSVFSCFVRQVTAPQGDESLEEAASTDGDEDAMMHSLLSMARKDDGYCRITLD